MNPCLLLQNPNTCCYRSWNLDGRLIRFFDQNWAWDEIILALSFLGYTPVSPNSRLGRTIHDKLALTKH